MSNLFLEELPPNGSICPTCGSKNLELWVSDGRYHLKCGDCGEMSEETSDEYAVKIMWLE